MTQDERGFTMVTLMGVLLIVVAMVFATYSMADGDLKPGKKDEDRKIAYAAAEAGVQNYLFHLLQNDDYWAQCTSVPAPHAVNQSWSGTGVDTRTRWLNVPDSPAQYAIELMPANGNPSCIPGSTASMIDSSTSALRIRVTGRASVASGAVKRSLVATLRRESFLDYVYFTDFETPPAALHDIEVGGRPTLENPRAGSPAPPQRDFMQWAAETCDQTYWQGGRGTLRFIGDKINNAGLYFAPNWVNMNRGCVDVPFAGPAAASSGNAGPTASDADAINGPMHTNDEIMVCGHPRFGRFPQDRIEIGGPGRALTGAETPATVGWRSGCGNPSSSPNVNFPGDTHTKLGTWIPNARPLTLPPANQSLRTDTDPTYRFVGRTIVRLDGDYMFVTGTLESGTVYDNTRIQLPPGGVLYASNASCGASYKTFAPYPAAPAPGMGCGDIEIQGTYSKSVTFGAQNDILVVEDVIKQGGFPAIPGDPAPAPDVLLGLVANGFVRAYHPAKNIVGATCTNDGAAGLDPHRPPGPAPDLRIDGAILAVAGAFINDLYFCGAPMGTLTINGAVAQKFRGRASTSNVDGTTIINGFKKNYVYDDRLRFRSPPHFIDPVGAGWQIQTFAEQVPAR